MWLRYVVNILSILFTMSEMALEFEKGFKYVRITFIDWKWLQYLRNGSNMWEVTEICWEWQKYLRNGLRT